MTINQELQGFLKFNIDSSLDLELPVPPENRRFTDKKGFIIFGILMLVLIPFLIYTLVKSDILRLKHGHDSCGNLCGIANEKISGIDCSGRNYTDKPYEKENIVTGERTCSEECPPGYSTPDNPCYHGDVLHGNGTEVLDVNMMDDFTTSWWKYIIISIITTILCLLALVLFRYCPGVVVWGVTGLSLALAFVVTGILWYAFSQANDDSARSTFLTLGLFSTLFTIVVVILFLCFFKKIPLIIELYQETSKALFAMPLIMALPVITLIIQLLVVGLAAITSTYMSTASNLVKNEENGFYEYERNGSMMFALIFNVIVTIWALYFLSGSQYMVIAGSVAQWFFKEGGVNFPISISFTNTMRFHLGTIAWGSSILTLFEVVKILIKSLISNAKLKCVVDCCCNNVEGFLKFLSNSAYVETAIYGEPFLKSGKRAADKLITNASSTISLNSVGDFVLSMTRFLLLVISTAIAYGIFKNNEYYWFLTLIGFFVNFLIVITVFNVFEVIVDTLFICFCEDMSLNDGSSSNPYRMSKGLMKFVDRTNRSS